MIRSKRKKPRPGRLKGDDLTELRFACYERDKAICQRCGHMTFNRLPQEHDESYHMAHRKGKRMFGDSLDNVQTECGACHRRYHVYGPSMEKPVPAKVRP
jgi:hypothetical protein